MTIFVGKNIKLEVAKTYSAASSAPSGITLANPGVVTLASHGYANGDVLIPTITSGMPELDGYAVRVAGQTTNTFELSGLNTTAFTAYSAGTFKKITAWSTITQAYAFNAPQAAASKLDITTLLDTIVKEIFGLAPSQTGTIPAYADPFNEANGLIKTASKGNTPICFRMTINATQVAIWNAYVTGGDGFNVSKGGVAETSYEFTTIGERSWFAS